MERSGEMNAAAAGGDVQNLHIQSMNTTVKVLHPPDFVFFTRSPPPLSLSLLKMTFLFLLLILYFFLFLVFLSTPLF